MELVGLGPGQRRADQRPELFWVLRRRPVLLPELDCPLDRTGADCLVRLDAGDSRQVGKGGHRSLARGHDARIDQQASGVTAAEGVVERLQCAARLPELEVGERDHVERLIAGHLESGAGGERAPGCERVLETGLEKQPLDAA